jgi:hypothetical protein
MKIGQHGRRLEGLERSAGAARGGWFAAVYRLDRERRAALALARFAQTLAGTEKPPPVEPSTEPSSEPSPGLSAAPRVLPPCRGPRAWGKDNRPGPHDVLTWEEVLRLPWLDANAADDLPEESTTPPVLARHGSKPCR